MGGMIVKCPRCAKKYRIGDAALPDEGAYLRCSNCENIFFTRRRTPEEAARLEAGREAGAKKTEPVFFGGADDEPPREESSGEDGEPAEEAEPAALEEAEAEHGNSVGEENSPEAAEKTQNIAARNDIDKIFAQARVENELEDEPAPPDETEEPQPSAKAPETAEPPDQAEQAAVDAALEEVMAAGETPGEQSASSQDDIDALLSETRSDPTGEDDGTQDSGTPPAPDGMDEMEETAGTAQEPPKTEGTPAPTRQDEVDALLAGARPGEGVAEEETPAPAMEEAAEATRDDIDALLSEARGEKEPEEDEGGGNVQDDIDNLLAEVGRGGEREKDEEPEKGVMAESREEEEEEEDEAGDLISQDDIDALLAEADGDEQAPESEQEEAEPPAMNVPGEAPEEAAPSPAMAIEEELDQLLDSGEDEIGEDLFKEGEEEIAEEEISIEPEGAAEEAVEEEVEEMLGIPSTAAPPAQADQAREAESFVPEPEEDVTETLPSQSLASIILGKIKTLAARAMPSPRGLAPGMKTAVIGAAAIAALAVLGGGYWFFYGGQETTPLKETDMAPETPLEKTEVKTEEEEKPVIEDLVAGEKAGPALPLGIYLPVEFNREATRIMNIDLELVFESGAIKEAFAKRKFYAAVTVEEAIQSFFQNKFYEDTIFVQEKLEEHINKSLKTNPKFAGLEKAVLVGITFE